MTEPAPPKGKPSAAVGTPGAPDPKGLESLAAVAAEMAKVRNPSAAQRLEMAIVSHLTALEGQLSTFSKSEAEKVGALKRIMAAAEDARQIQTEAKETMQELIQVIKENTKAKVEQKAATKELVTQLKVAGLATAKAQPAVAPPLVIVANKPAEPVPAKGAPLQPAQPGPGDRAPEKAKVKPGGEPGAPKPEKAPVALLKKPVEQVEKPRKKRSSSSSSGSSSSASTSEAEPKRKRKNKDKKARASSSTSDSPATIGKKEGGSGDDSDALSVKVPSIPELAAAANRDPDLRESLSKKGGFVAKAAASRSKGEREVERRSMAPPTLHVRGRPRLPPVPVPVYRPAAGHGGLQYDPPESDGTDAEMASYDPYYAQFDDPQAAFEFARRQRGDMRRQSFYPAPLPPQDAEGYYGRRRQRRRQVNRNLF